ncbi:hypothetical protein BDA96_08G124000 [Sorghum bicolor]|uniref:Major facilitator superfamily (MFS) profile domain-containing protein n=1 Tax=Sorghum bicolor TaxID=4558 RepID=A0A921U786_SORBI|nr:hypothetical protein BDA96_08G124000 [Sorghum bicolor]
MKKEEDDLESPLLADIKEPAPADGSTKGCTYALVCALLASVTSIIYGYNRGVMSGAQKFIQADLGVTDAQLEVLIGATSVYSLLGSLAAGWACDRAGRRRTVALSAALFLAGSAVTAAADGYAALMAGQLVAGVACGFGLVVAPVYIAEISPADARGFLSSIPEIAGNSGILLSYIADFALAGLPTQLNWRLMIGIGAVPPLFLSAAATFAMPETPRWLVLHGHRDEARRVLARTVGDADRRLQEIVTSVREATKQAAGGSGGGTAPPPSTSVWREILLRPTPAVRRVMLAILGLQVFQQACGVAAMVLYAPRVFSHVGITSERAVLGATVLLGAAKTAAIVVPLFLADRLGRRPMLLASAGGMAASLLVLGLSMSMSMSMSMGGGATTTAAATTCVAAAVAYMATFSLGFGPVIWMYGSEILPLRLRAQGTGVGTAVNRVMSAVVGMTFISMYEAVGMAGTFYIFAALSAAAWVFVYACLPETKGRSLEEMEALFDAGAAPSTRAALSS